MGCTVSTCNYTEPMMLNRDIINVLDMPVFKDKVDNRIPHYKRQNSLTIDTSWGGKI